MKTTVSLEVTIFRNLNGFEISMYDYSLDDIVRNEVVSQKSNFKINLPDINLPNFTINNSAI